jgi:xanthine dehydrogenase accessory factor
MKHIYQKLAESMSTHPALALATVTGAVGSTPQKQGSSAVFCDTGLLAGTVGGGITEGKVWEIIRDSIPLKTSGHYHFNLDKDISYEQDAICGGQMNILIDVTPGDHRLVFERLVSSVQDGIPGVLITKITPTSNQSVEIKRYWITVTDPRRKEEAFLHSISPVLRDYLADGIPEDYLELKPSAGEHGDRVFVEPVFPPPRLIIAGAGHVGKALAHIGNLLDFDVTVVDDRAEYANSSHIPDADHLMVGNIGQTLLHMKKTPDTYIVIVTRAHKDDAEALKAVIGSQVAYIGMMGSAKKVAQVREKFLFEGWASLQQWEQVHTPIGLPIHSKTVQEIAVSISAQLVQVRNTINIRHV